ncbi:DUF4190 domain-containing protein [Streptomyces hainanensis]|uniref:DUF4190 domain-containing protein n=1 Tax=Streptomyces hainanensis TaxID=402648 RepID=A0A4R4TKM2_9ACTN|nr:DUF4190 domain-containing protein [Streptomyces hainanensis]TDC75613.1 DUF4190 domain-containing protein [Streptomyces hainanensis]
MSAEQQSNPYRPPAGGVAPPHLAWVPPQWYPQPVWPVAQRPPNESVGNAALVFGLISVLLSWTYFLSPFALVLGIGALVLGLVGLENVRGGRARNRVFAHGGLWTGVAGIAISAVLTLLAMVSGGGSTTGVRSDAGAVFLAGPDDEVVYDDGVSVTIAEPRASDAGYLLVVRVTNDGAYPVDLGESSVRARLGGEPAVARVSTGGPPEVAPGDSGSVAFEISGASGDPGPLDVDYAPADAYAYGFWAFDPGPAGGGSEVPEPGSGGGGVEA